MIRHLKEISVNKTEYEKLPEEKRMGKIVIGELYRGERPEYTDEYIKIIESFKGEI